MKNGWIKLQFMTISKIRGKYKSLVFNGKNREQHFILYFVVD